MYRRTSALTWSRLATIAALLFVVLPSARAWAQDTEVDLSTTSGRGQACTQWFYGQQFDKIEALRVTPAMRDALVTLGGFAGFRETVNAQLGVEVEVLSEIVTQQQGLDIYTRMTKFEKYAGDIVVQWVFDAEGAIAGFAIRPAQ